MKKLFLITTILCGTLVAPVFSEAPSEESDIHPIEIYIESSSNEEEVYNELVKRHPELGGHGILCGNDWSLPSMNQAIIRFAKERDLHITVHNQSHWVISN